MSNRINDIKELTPRMQRKVLSFLDECKRNGLDCLPFETYRSQERQNELYAQGRTKPGNIVTWTLNSRHKQREAVDMAFGGEGKWHWNGDWDKMITIAKNFGLESLAPREKAHLQDDGTEFNSNTMEFDNTNYKDMEGSNGYLTSLDGDGALTHGEIKALINIANNRQEEQLVNKIATRVLETILSRLANK